MCDPSSKPKLALIVGPTASGKSALAVQLAQRLEAGGQRAVILNADSAQVYADLATLAPQAEALASLGDGLVIDHLGMTEAGLPLLLDLVATGAMVKATGFGRVALDVRNALERVEAAPVPAAVVAATSNV